MRLLHRGVRIWFSVFSLAVATLAMVGCAPQHAGSPPIATNTNTTSPDAVIRRNPPLQNNDRITVIITGTPKEILPMDKVISEDGTITIANIDHPIMAAGKSPQALQEDIRTNLVPDIYTHCNVTVIQAGQFYYVLGEVNPSSGGGKLQYTGSGITVTKAIATAGGFNPFASRSRVQLTRQDGTILIIDCTKAVKDPKFDVEVFPGDSIFVPKTGIWGAVKGGD
jgi:protein involved in polysaccharide export with SLBB domain